MNKEFKKEDLKTGMLVEYRDGDLRLVVPYGENNNLYLIGKSGENSLTNYTDDLLHIYSAKYLDIVKIYSQTKHLFQYMKISTENRELLWERKSQEQIRKENIVKKNEMLTQREQLLKELKDKEHQLDKLEESYCLFMEENFKGDSAYYIPDDIKQNVLIVGQNKIVSGCKMRI